MAPHADDSEGYAIGGGNGLVSSDPKALIVVEDPNVEETSEYIKTTYTYRTTATALKDGRKVATRKEDVLDFKTDLRVPKVGVMLVGLGGNNGSTIVAGIMANKQGLKWETKEGVQSSNYYGSVIMGSTVKLGLNAKNGDDDNVSFHELMPLIHPNDLTIGGWDISGFNLAEAMDRAKVLEPTLKEQVRKEMAAMKPLPSIYYPQFIAMNQKERADNVIPGEKPSKDHLEHIRKDIRDFKTANGLDKVIVLWTANTERYASLLDGVNDTADNLLKAIEDGHTEVAPSTVFAVASILEGAPFINGSPQNTFVPGAIELAEKHKAFIGGDDFKSGQTKMKSALVDFLINAGIKVTSVASYNHLGNNDGMNLSSNEQFKSKEISKSNVVDDMVKANHILYKAGEKPDHCVVIKYMPDVGDDKRALDEYNADIWMGGKQTITMSNVCQDSLLASPLIIDLVLVAEMMTRVSWKKHGSDEDYQGFNSVLSILSYMLKAPLTPTGTPVVNSLVKQRAALVNIFRACRGLDPESDMTLEHKLL